MCDDPSEQDSQSSSYIDFPELVVLDDLSDLFAKVSQQINGRKRALKESEKRLAEVRNKIATIRREY